MEMKQECFENYLTEDIGGCVSEYRGSVEDGNEHGWMPNQCS